MKLNPTQLAKAIEWNPYYGQQVGWQSRYVDVLRFLGYPSTCPTAELFAQSVADWQAKRPPLTPDGLLGPGTWSKMEPEIRRSPGGAPPAPAPVPEPAPTGAGPPWYQYAQSEANRWATMIASWGDTKNANKAEQYTNFDELYFRASPFFEGTSHPDGVTPLTQNLDWCAAFVNWCLHRAGYSHTGSARAGSFLDWDKWKFNALKSPQPGCIIVLNNGTHVTFYSHWSGTIEHNPKGDVWIPEKQGISFLGGNQSKRVRVKAYSQVTLTARKGLNNVTSPYLWPLRGESCCGITSVPTAQPHHCCVQPT